MKKLEKKSFWYLPLDNYNQPSGNIIELKLTETEYQAMKNRGEYIYNSYYQAILRAYN